MRTIRIRPGRDTRGERCDAIHFVGGEWVRCPNRQTTEVPYSNTKGVCDACFEELCRQLPAGDSKKKPTERVASPASKWGNCRCLSCEKMFRSWDVRHNRICTKCRKAQEQMPSPEDEVFMPLAAGREKRLSEMPLLTGPERSGRKE